MRVLGIDCGTEKTGYGVIESDGRRHRLITAGVIRTSAKQDLQVRLLGIARGLREVVEKHRPEVAAVEEVFYSQNVKTALKLCHQLMVKALLGLGQIIDSEDASDACAVAICHATRRPAAKPVGMPA